MKRRQADANRVADPVGQQRAQPHRGLQAARPARPRLRDPEMQRMVDLLAQQPVGRDRVGHVRGLDRDLEVREVQAMHELDELRRRRRQRLDRVLALQRVQMLGQRARVHPDPHRRARALARATTSATFSGPPMLPGFRRMQCAPASIAFSASVWLKWMSATTGIGDRTTIVRSASISRSRGTATRTMSAPASATLRI